jgi:CheY-like chemotaxis protein
MQRIVVVDDEPELLDVVCELLDEEGYSTVCVDHPAKALELEPEPPADLFLVDLMLPGFNGIELAKRLRESGYADTPMIAMSASLTMLEEAAGSHLFEEAMAKPFDLTELLECVEQYVRAAG